MEQQDLVRLHFQKQLYSSRQITPPKTEQPFHLLESQGSRGAVDIYEVSKKDFMSGAGRCVHG